MIPRRRNASRLRRSIGLALRRAREAQGLTLDQMAVRCRCSRSTVARWEQAPTLDAIGRVALALRVPVRSLVPDEVAQ